MADTAIFGLTQETALTAAMRFPLQETSSATRATSSTFALMGGLEINNQTITTADVTGAVGQLYVCTIAGLTADRNLTLPSAQVGERVGVYIVDGDDTYELILKGAASQTINGGSAATEWSRVYVKGDCVVFRCVAANTWIVEADGRLGMQDFFVRQSGNSVSQQTITASTYTPIEGDVLNSADYDRFGSLTNVGTGGSQVYFTPPVNGKYLLGGLAIMNALSADCKVISLLMVNGGSTDSTRYILGRGWNNVASGVSGFAGAHMLKLTTSDTVRLGVWTDSTGTPVMGAPDNYVLFWGRLIAET